MLREFNDRTSHYEYDKAGEESAIVPKADTSGATFAYNAAGELSSLTPTGERALSLTYGGTGQDDLVTRGSTITVENSLLGITREVITGNPDCFERTPNGLLIDVRTPSANYDPLYDGQDDIIALVSYDPTTGRWTQPDPEDHLGSTPQPDLFTFAGGNPLNNSDPNGRG